MATPANSNSSGTARPASWLPGWVPGDHVVPLAPHDENRSKNRSTARDPEKIGELIEKK